MTIPHKIPRRETLLLAGASLTGCLGSKKTKRTLPRATWGSEDATLLVRGFFDILTVQGESWFRDVFPDLRKEYTDDDNIRFEFWHFPVMNDLSWSVANAQVEILKTNRDWFMDEPLRLFQELTTKSTVSDVESKMVDAGIPKSRAKTVAKTEPYTDGVRRDYETARDLGVTRTPTVMVEEEIISNPFNYTLISSNIAQRL